MNIVKTLTLTGVLVSSATVSGQSFVGWETWAGATSVGSSQNASLTIGGLTGSVMATPETGGNISTWTNATADYAASGDGTFGTLSSPSAVTTLEAGQGIAVTSGYDGYFDFTVNNTNPGPVDLTGFSFDAGAFRPNASRNWELTVQSGSLSLGFVASGGPVDHSGGAGGMSNDYDISLTSLVDSTLESGESAVFRLNWTGGTDDSGGHHLMLDNVGITAVPEPSTIALVFGAATLFLVAYRRRRG